MARHPNACVAIVSPYMLYSNMREFIIYQGNDDQWTAEAKEIPGLRVTGKTQEEALAKIKSAILLYNPCRCEE